MITQGIQWILEQHESHYIVFLGIYIIKKMDMKTVEYYDWGLILLRPQRLNQPENVIFHITFLQQNIHENHEIEFKW